MLIKAFMILNISHHLTTGFPMMQGFRKHLGKTKKWLPCLGKVMKFDKLVKSPWILFQAKAFSYTQHCCAIPPVHFIYLSSQTAVTCPTFTNSKWKPTGQVTDLWSLGSHMTAWPILHNTNTLWLAVVVVWAVTSSSWQFNILRDQRWPY